MDIEDKLLKFRQESLKKPENSIKPSSLYDYFKSAKIFQSNSAQTSKKQETHTTQLKNSELKKRPTPKLIVHHVEKEDEENTSESRNQGSRNFKIFVAEIVLKFLLWVTLFALFIILEFGAVYFVISLLVIIYLNTGKRKKGQISAYSVFNPNMERIQGTLTPEHIEKSIVGTF